MRILFQQYDTDQSGEYTDDIAQFRYLTREQADKANESLIASSSALRWLEVKEETEHEVTIEGKKDYVELSKLINKYEDLKVSMLIAFASGGQSWGGGLKEGLFKVTNMPRARQVCEWIMQIRKGHPFCLEKAFGMALMGTIEKEADFQRLLKNSKRDSFVKCFSDQEYKKLILDHLKA